MTSVLVKLNEDDVNLLRRILVDEIEKLELDKVKCSHDVEFKIIKKNLNCHIRHANKLLKRICKAYNDEVML